MSETAETVPEPLGGGALLRQAREQAGVHVAALAVALKVPVRQLEALEQDRLDLLPDHTFARALAGSVCRQLKADPTPILAALPQGSPRPVSVSPGLNEPFRPPGAAGAMGWRERLWRPPVLAALALLLAALTLIFLPGQDSPDAPAAPGSTRPQAEQPTVAAPPALGASQNMVVEQVTPNLVPSVPALPAASAASVPAPPSPPLAAPAARQP
ncbi:MAG: hypothetical protein RL522_1016 [Pseudomonadota bacterium]|jgi:cytoskeleton protein RodZ